MKPVADAVTSGSIGRIALSPEPANVTKLHDLIWQAFSTRKTQRCLAQLLDQLCSSGPEPFLNLKISRALQK